ncbi:MAG: 50S ribosomal protein L10, partial [Pseudomonadota bacterium]
VDGVRVWGAFAGDLFDPWADADGWKHLDANPGCFGWSEHLNWRTVMDKAGKQVARQELEEIFESAGSVVVTHYSGLSVADMTKLRTTLREKGDGRLKVVKNRIAKIALKGKGGDAAADLFKGPVAIAYGDEPSTAAKATTEFAKENDNLKLIGAIMGDECMDAAGIDVLATMPSREEMIATVVARLLGQGSQIATRINAPGQALAGALEAIQEQAAS